MTQQALPLGFAPGFHGLAFRSALTVNFTREQRNRKACKSLIVR
jgi:hypothetical protein